MTKYLLDTNIISEIYRPNASTKLLAWMADRRDEELFTSTITIAEINAGIFKLPQGKRRRRLEAELLSNKGPANLFRNRILSFDLAATPHWARFMAEGQQAGRPRPALDTMIAAIARANDCVVVTANDKDFAGFVTINPKSDTGFADFEFIERIRSVTVDPEHVFALIEEMGTTEASEETMIITAHTVLGRETEAIYHQTLVLRMQAFIKLLDEGPKDGTTVVFRDNGAAMITPNTMRAVATAPLNQFLEFDMSAFNAHIASVGFPS